MYSFDDVKESKRYLRTPGIQMEATFVSLTYEATETWEGFDIELQVADGSTFRERTFGPNIDKVYPKDKWVDGVKQGMETKEEAFDRVGKEISTKLYHLACCFVPAADVKDGVKACKDMKSFVAAINKLLTNNVDKKINFLTIWKNSDTKKRSNLIIAEKIKWVEAAQYNTDGTVKKAGISLTKWQNENCLIEKYPYNGGNSESPILDGAEAPARPIDDLPF